MTKKVCCVGVCMGMTWDEAKEFIINKHNSLFWESWVYRVSWRELTEMEEKLIAENKELKEEIKQMKEFTLGVISDKEELQKALDFHLCEINDIVNEKEESESESEDEEEESEEMKKLLKENEELKKKIIAQ